MAVDNNQSCHCESLKNMITAKKEQKMLQESLMEAIIGGQGTITCAFCD